MWSPLTSYAATGPFESLLAEGHAYRQAAGRPQKLITVLGIWAIFGTMAMTGVASLLFARTGGFVGEAVLGGFLLIISAAIIWRTTMNYRAWKRQGLHSSN
jgi:hypothetical protein